MRVVWKDSNPKTYKPVKYRGYVLQGSTRGWTISVPGDNNLYNSHYCAQNAVDKALGDYGTRGSEKRKRMGIQIVGQNDGVTG